MARKSRKRDMAIMGLLMGHTIPEAAEYAGIGSRTLDRWLTQPEFRKRLEDAQQAVFERHIAALAELTGLGIGRLRQILRDDKAGPGHWLRATELVLREARNSEAAQIREEIRLLQETIERRS